RTTKLARQVIRVHREERAPLTITIVGRLAQRVVAVDLKHATQPAVEANEELALVKLTTRFVTINVAFSRIGPAAVRRELAARPRKRTIDVTRANHVRDAKIEETDEHRYVARELSLDLRPQHPHGGILDVRIHQPGRLLRCRDSCH